MTRQPIPLLGYVLFGVLLGCEQDTHLSSPEVDYVAEGLAHLTEGNPNTAIERFTEAIRRKQNVIEAYLHRAKALRKKGKTAAALSDLSRVVRLEPTHPEAHFELGKSYASRRQYQNALKSYTLAIENSPEMVFFELDQLPPAIRDCDVAIEIDPNRASAYVDRGVYYKGLGQRQRAIQDWKTAMRLDPQYPSTYLSFALDHLSRHEFDDALRHLNKVLELHPRHFPALRYRAGAYAALNRHPEAIDDFTRLIEKLHRNPQDYLGRSQSYRSLGRIAEAEADVRRANQLSVMRNQ
jgi:tetratricopeptide (TPR) repeat protein